MRSSTVLLNAIMYKCGSERGMNHASRYGWRLCSISLRDRLRWVASSMTLGREFAL
jgi:hypothetical protein